MKAKAAILHECEAALNISGMPPTLPLSQRVLAPFCNVLLREAAVIFGSVSLRPLPSPVFGALDNIAAG